MISEIRFLCDVLGLLLFSYRYAEQLGLERPLFDSCFAAYLCFDRTEFTGAARCVSEQESRPVGTHPIVSYAG